MFILRTETEGDDIMGMIISGELKDGDTIYKYYFSKNDTNDLIERKCIVNTCPGNFGFIIKDPVLGTTTHYSYSRVKNIVLLAKSDKKKALNVMKNSYLRRKETVEKNLDFINCQIDFLDNKIKELP